MDNLYNIEICRRGVNRHRIGDHLQVQPGWAQIIPREGMGVLRGEGTRGENRGRRPPLTQSRAFNARPRLTSCA